MDMPRYLDASREPLVVIRSNECDSELGSLSTRRFQALWNEFDRLRAKLAAAPHPAGSAGQEPVTDAMVETAAEAYWLEVYGRHRKSQKWPDDVHGRSEELFRSGCRAALEAVFASPPPAVAEEVADRHAEYLETMAVMARHQ